MQIAVFGINLEHSEIQVSDKLISKISSFLPYFDIIPLVTCNRFEIYINTSQISFLKRVFYDFLKADIGSKLDRSYLLFSYDCFYHLCKTVCGLDSAILGESEIQHQVKKAYLNASDQKLAFCLHFLFQKALKIGKHIRTNFLAHNSCFKLTELIWGEIRTLYSNPSVLLIGKSQINQRIKSFLKKKKVENITVSSRFIKDSSNAFLPFSQIHKWAEFDVVICATKVGSKCIFPMQTKKKVLLFDLSMPAVVDLKVIENENVVFWSLSKINAYFSKQKNHHIKDIQKCLEEIKKQVNIQKNIFKKKERNRLIYQEKAS